MCWYLLQLTANYQKIAFFNLSERFFTSYTCMRFCGDMITLRECFVVICACNNVWGFLISVTMMRWNLPTPRTYTLCLENPSILWLVLLSIQQSTPFSHTFIYKVKDNVDIYVVEQRLEMIGRAINIHMSLQKKNLCEGEKSLNLRGPPTEYIHASHIWWQQI